LCGAGDPCARHGASISIYGCNSSMHDRAFCNADGDLLIGRINYSKNFLFDLI
jgi:homogentisate 1,2-dioxygenase